MQRNSTALNDKRNPVVTVMKPLVLCFTDIHWAGQRQASVRVCTRVVAR